MIAERTAGAHEGRAILIGMITSKAVAGAVAARWDREGLFSSRWENLVGAWAVEYYRRYRRAPGRNIEGYYDLWAAGGQDRDTARLVGGFLDGLSAEYARARTGQNPDYVLDLAARHFDMVAVRRLRDELAGDLEAADVVKARDRIAAFRPVPVGAAAGIEPFSDEAAMIAAFEQADEVLIEYPGALGGFFQTALARDNFIGFMGKEKVGKSYWLLDLAVRGLEQGRNVAWIEAGDMSQNQVMRRIGSRAAGRPVRADARVRVPVSIETGKPPTIEFRDTAWDTDLTPDEAVRAVRRAARQWPGGRADGLKLSCHPNSTVSVAGIEAVLDGWRRDGWVPDVVVVDYADILAPLDGRAETRDQINATWKALRALSQRWHCLCVTATQTDADSYTAQLLSRDNFSEDKRKYAHVTGMVGINQTEQDKDEQTYRLNWVALRELEFSEEKQVYTAACLAIQNPAVLSTF